MATQKLRPKEEIINVVIDPNVKKQLRTIAAIEGRSMAAQIGIFLKKAVEEYNKQHQLPVEEVLQPVKTINRRSFSSRWKSD